MRSGIVTSDAMKAMLEARLAAMPGRLRILEAGCGRGWPLRLSVPYTLVGLDMDADALAARKDLDQAVVGDLRTAEFPADSFDVIYNSFVLEHVSGARQVLDRFLHWLAPGGVLIIHVPDRDSAFGLLTRLTPHWFHVLYYRYVVGYRAAGTPGHGPYRTYYDQVISLRGMEEFFARPQLAAPEIYRMCSYTHQRATRAAAFATSLLSAGLLPWRHNTLTAIVQDARRPIPASGVETMVNDAGTAAKVSGASPQPVS
jgi:SAM-dependent methyltransferase